MIFRMGFLYQVFEFDSNITFPFPRKGLKSSKR